jgi:DNA-binding response OmpR family regulator
MNILIAEDEPEFQEDIISSLETLGYKTYKIVDDSKKALDYLNKIQPDLIILDLKLKHKTSGIDVLEYLFKNNIPMPVLVHSNFITENLSELNCYRGSNFLTVELVLKSNSDLLLNKIPDILERHSCKILKEFSFPNLKLQFEDLRNKVETLEENNPLNFDLKKELKEIGKQVVFKNKKAIAVIITLITGAILNTIPSLALYSDLILKQFHIITETTLDTITETNPSSAEPIKTP